MDKYIGDFLKSLKGAVASRKLIYVIVAVLSAKYLAGATPDQLLDLIMQGLYLTVGGTAAEDIASKLGINLKIGKKK